MEIETVKCVVVGDSFVGKSSMIYSYATGNGLQVWYPNCVENYSLPMAIDGTKLVLNPWDTAGQDDFDRLRPLSYPNTDIFLVCFSLIDPQSYESVYRKWYPELKHYSPNTPIILVGTKHDLKTPDNSAQLRGNKSAPLSREDGLCLCQDIGALRYFECSAKTGAGLEKVFREAARYVISLKTSQPQT